MSPENRPGDEYADRLRDVLRAEAEAVVPAADGLAHIRERTARRGAVMRWVRPAAVAGSAAVVAGAVVLGFALTGNDTHRLHQNPPLPGASITETPTTTSPTPVAPPAPAALSLPVGLPVWPFADGVAAAAGAASATGSPSVVALKFTTVHLGFTDDNLALGTTKSADGQQAWVSIGFHTEGTRTSTAAVVHLARWSGNGPWEVVGTKDTTLTLTKPSYGAVAHSPLTVGGTITGVDESIRVAVHQASTNRPLGIACCTAAGGQATPWSTTVTYGSSKAAALTVVASTGGHLIEHERWAITAVRTQSASAPSSSSSAPSTFVAKASDRIGVYRSSDATRVRWLTPSNPGAGVDLPQHVGDYVYFLRGLGHCPDMLVRVPYAGGSETPAFKTRPGESIDGYDVSSNGRLALSMHQCSDNTQRFYVVDPKTGQTHGTPYSGTPPAIQSLAWAPDNTHVALVVRTGTKAQVRLIDAFAATKVLSGTTPCGDPNGLPELVTYAGGQPVVEMLAGGSHAFATCSGGSTHNLFTVDINEVNTLDGTSSDALIFSTAGGDSIGPVYIWTGGKPRALPTSSSACSSISKTPYPCAQQAAW